MANHAKHFLYTEPFPSVYHLFIKIPIWVFNASLPVNPATIGDFIKKLRIEQGLFQKELAEGIAVDEMTIVNWEKSGTKPARKHIERLAEYFSRNPEELMKGWR
jgi:DNA-binding XRE family transcriptional regulator